MTKFNLEFWILIVRILNVLMLLILSRKSRVKRVVKVPAISLKMSDIPPDDYSWRKYGQKPIKGSPHPR